MLTPPGKELKNQPVRLADLTLNETVLEGYTFESCRILGPAVIAMLRDVDISHCSWDAEDFDTLAWVVPAERQRVVGAVGLVDCRFYGCRFENVGLAVPEHMVEDVRAGFES